MPQVRDPKTGRYTSGGGSSVGGAAGTNPRVSKARAVGAGATAGGASAGSEAKVNPKHQRTAENFLKNSTLSNSDRALVASNQFSYAGLSNKQVVNALNSMGKDKFELVTETQKGNIWTNGAPIIREYIVRKKSGN